MALSDDPTKKTSTVAAPPKEPPIFSVDTGGIADTPKPEYSPADITKPTPQYTSNQTSQPDPNPTLNQLKKSGPPSDQALLKLFKSNPVSVIKEINLPQNNAERVRLKRLIDRYAPKDQQLYQAWESAKAQIPNLREKSLILSRKPQPQPIPAQEIPEYKPAEQVIEKPVKRNGITPENAPKIQAWMNNLKPGFYKWLAEKKFDAATSQRIFTNSFLEYLGMYKGGLAGFYLSQGAHELIYSALGPIGEVLTGLHQKDLRWKMAWMKNPLNPNALYYYLNILPEEKAFKLLYVPAKATWAILAKGGAPLITKATYRETGRHGYGQVKTGYFFTPTLKLAQGANILADGLDKLTGIPTNDNFFRLDLSQPSPFDQYINKKTHDFADAIKELKKAKIMGQPSRIFGANQKIKNLLRQYDGNFVKQWFKPGLSNLSRRLRQHHKDPVSYLLALVGGAIFDVLVGIGVNLAKTIATRALGWIPGFNTLRATLAEFFTSDRYLNTARIGGTTGQAFVKGVFSPTTLASGYVGYRVGSLITPNLYFNLYGVPINVGGAIAAPIFAGGGAFYNTARIMSFTEIPLWTREYQVYKAAQTWRLDEGGTWGEQMIKDKYLKGFKPGPFSRFASWLYEHPFARLPINGFVIGDLLSPLIQARFGWNPWITRGVFAGVDYFWQTKGAWGNLINKVILKPIVKILTQQTWTIFGKTFFTPYWKLFSLENPTSWFTKIYNRWIGFSKFGIPGATLEFIDKPWLNTLKNFWSKAQIYARSFFNPGFFAGFSLIKPLIAAGMNPVLAVFFGPIAGSAAFLLGSRALIAVAQGIGIKSIGGISIAGKFGLNALPQINAWSWLGMGIGWGLDLIIPGSQAWLVPVFTYGLPVVLTLFPSIGSFFGGLLVNISYFASNAAWALGISLPSYAAWVATWATITSIAAVAGLTVFFAYAIFAGFWVPFQQVNRAGPESTFFSTNTTVTNTDGQLEICSKINVKNDLLTEVNYINHLVYYVFSGLTVADFDPNQPNKYVSKATRQGPYESLTNLQYNDSVSCPGFTNKNYFASFDASYILLPSLVGLPVHNTYLSTFTACETGKKTIFELQQMFPQSYGLQQISDGYIDFLNQINEDRDDGNNDNDTKAKLDATLDVLNKIISKFDDVVNLVKNAINQDNLASIQEKIGQAYTLTETASKPENNPFIGKYDSFEAFQASCNYQESTCREIYGIYQSYSTFFQSQLSTLASLKRSVDNPSANLAELKKQIENAYYSLNSTLQNSKAQKQATQDSKDVAIDLYGDDGFWNNWLSILTNLSGSQLTEIQNMLLAAFQDIFKKKFYFTPARTVYEVCLNAKWIRPDLLPYTFPVVVYFTNPPAMFNYNYFSPTVNFYTIPTP